MGLGEGHGTMTQKGVENHRKTMAFFKKMALTVVAALPGVSCRGQKASAVNVFGGRLSQRLVCGV